MSGSLPVLAVALVGSVDHGKSTLLGRLLYETGTVPAARVAQLEALSARRGVALEWSFLLDSLQAERDQAVTIDITQVRIHWNQRDYVFVDAPGHVEFLRNLVTGIACADVAVLMVDGTQGSREQTRRHSALLRLIGILDVIVVVNKIDLCPQPADAFAAIAETVGKHLGQLGIRVRACVPVNAREGVNVLARSTVTPWYQGPSLLQALELIEPVKESSQLPLRVPIQDVYRTGQTRQIVGRVATGTLHSGDEILLSPSGARCRIRSLMPAEGASAGTNVAIELDDIVFAARGDLISHVQHPPKLTRVFDAELFWLAERTLVPGTSLRMRLTTLVVDVQAQAIRWALGDDGVTQMVADRLERFAIGAVTLRAEHALAVDDFTFIPATGRFVLLDGQDVVGIGVIDASRYPDLRLHPTAARQNIVPTLHALTEGERKDRYGHPGAVIWLTGLSGAGKSTLAMELEQRLFKLGCAVYVLDGDNLRDGLNGDLGFGPDDRRENVRRAGEVAALFADAGLICIVALISPYRDDRERARVAAAPHPFCEVFVDASLAVCEARDPKGLYRRARAHQLPGFTGVDAPYEIPWQPDMTLATGDKSIEDCNQELFEFTTLRLGVPR